MKDWQIKKIKDVALVTAGQSPEGKFYNNDGLGMPFFQGKKEFNDKYIGDAKVWTTKITKVAEIGDVLMSVRAPVGPINFATEQCCIGRGLASIRVKEKFDKDFLFLFFKNIENQLTGNTGAVFNSINKGQIENIPIPIPSLPEQQKIVEKLDTAFELIDQAKANIEKNIQNAKELFQSKLNDVFSQKGDGFLRIELSKVLLKTENINPKQFVDKTFKYIDVSAVDRNLLKINDAVDIDSANAPSRARKLIKVNDVIFATVRPTLRRVAIVDEKYDSQICSTGYVVLRNDETKILHQLIFYYLLTSEFLENMEKMQKGASYPAVSDREVKSQLINYPKSLETQQKIVEQLDQLSAQTKMLQEKYKQKLANLEELKKSILEKAFKGELV